MRLPTKLALVAVPLLLWVSHPSVAQPTEPVTTTSPQPYSLPWQLRPAAATTALRSDTAFAFFDPGTSSGSTIATTLLASYKVRPDLAPMVRLALVHHDPGGPPGNGTAFVNPLLGLTYARPLGHGLRLALFLGATVPVGQGGDALPGNSATAAAAAAGVNARSAMDNALFAVNFFTVLPGVSLAYVQHGFTAQVEATLLQLTRVRNKDVERDARRTNFTTGLHLGYFLLPALSVGGELRYQRWLSDPAFLAMAPERRETVTVAVGPRAHFKLGQIWFRPGLSYAQGLDDPLSRLDYRIVQLDLPLIF